MNTTATAPKTTVTHAIISPLVTYTNGIDFNGTEDLTIGWSRQKTSVEGFRVFETYGLFQNGTPRTFARLADGWVENCRRCGGSGNYGFGPDNGVCYKCNGYGTTDSYHTEDEMTAKMVTWGRGVRTTSNKAQAKYEARQAEIAAYRAEHAELITWAVALVPTESETVYYSSSAEPVVEEWCNQFGRKAGLFIRDLRDGTTLDKSQTAYLYKVMATAIERKANDTSRHAGAVGDKVTVTGTVTTAREVDGLYGTTFLVVVKGTGADEGVTLKSFTTAKSAWDLELGMAVSVTATIKDHKTYQDSAEDMVSRPKYTVL
jgi:hypothetical protein